MSFRFESVKPKDKKDCNCTLGECPYYRKALDMVVDFEHQLNDVETRLRNATEAEYERAVRLAFWGLLYRLEYLDGQPHHIAQPEIDWILCLRNGFNLSYQEIAKICNRGTQTIHSVLTNGIENQEETKV